MSKAKKLTEMLKEAGLFEKTISRDERKMIFGGYDCTTGQATTSHTCDGCCDGIDKAKDDCTLDCIP